MSKKSTMEGRDDAGSSVSEQNVPNATDILMADTGEADKIRQERDNFLSLLRQTKADFDNYQKRAAREIETERKFAQRPLALEVVRAIDNLDRFLASIKEETELTKVVSTVQKQLLEGLERQGIKRIDSVGNPFDPNREEAILEQPSDQPPGTVITEVEAGYQYHDRVLRPAKVIVAKAF